MLTHAPMSTSVIPIHLIVLIDAVSVGHMGGVAYDPRTALGCDCATRAPATRISRLLIVATGSQEPRRRVCLNVQHCTATPYAAGSYQNPAPPRLRCLAFCQRS